MPAELITALVAMATAVIGLIISQIQLQTRRNENKAIKEKVVSIEQALQADDTEYYVICPECKSKILLSKTKIFIEDKYKKDNKQK